MHKDVYGRTIQLGLCVHAKCLWDAVTGMKTPTEKCLLIDLSTMRDEYEVPRLSNIYWLPNEANLTNDLKKKVMSEALSQMMTGNRLELNPQAWVESQVKET